MNDTKTHGDGDTDTAQVTKFKHTLTASNFAAVSLSRKSPSLISQTTPSHIDFLKNRTNEKRYVIDLLGVESTPASETLTLSPDDAFSIEDTLGALDFSDATGLLIRGIEAIRDPRLLFRKLRHLLKQNDNNYIELIADIASKDDYDSLPVNPRYVRIWDRAGLKNFLLSSGFNVVDDELSQPDVLRLTITADEKSHRKLLDSYNFPAPKYSMIITTEHADTPHTGGIGSYVKEVEQNDPKNKPIVMYVNHEHFDTITTLGSKSTNIIDIHDLIDKPFIEHTIEWNGLSTSVYLAFKNMIYLYDQVHLVEYQEYLGPGARLAAAKKSGEIPIDTKLVARCHGSQVYIDRAAQNWSGIEIGDVFELERMSLRYADIVSSPTKYLRDLYQSTGYEFDFVNSPILRLPYQYPDVPVVQRQSITKLAFVGKRNKMKGYEDFCATVIEVTDPNSARYCPDISDILVLGASVPGCDEQDDILRKTLESRNIALDMRQLPRAELLSLYESSSSDTLFILPYGADNHPVVILEMIAYSCAFVSYNTGGIPELVPNEFHVQFMTPPDQSWLAEKVKNTCNLKPKDLESKIKKLRSKAVRDQQRINKEIADIYRNGYLSSEDQIALPDHLQDLATIMVPCFNTPIEYVKILIESLNSQILAPKEVLFIDDKSTDKNYGAKLKQLIDSTIKLPYRIITHDENKGLSGARNSGLHYCQTKYLINIDSDDVASPTFVYDYVNLLEKNPSYSAAVCGLESFLDTDDWNQSKDAEETYRYVALGDCFVLGTTKNVFGHAGSCVLVSKARELGGWDASDRSMWEDWAFYLKMAGRNEKILAFPKVNYFYRVNPGSMLRSYPEYPASQRIVRNIGMVNIWESQRFYSYLKDGTRLALAPPPQVIQVEPSTRSYKIMKRTETKIHTVFHNSPLIHKAALKILSLAKRIK